MSQPADIGRIGEKAVVDNLTSQGYTIIEWNTQAPGATDIEASNSKEHILVQVKSAMYPSIPVDLSQADIAAIKSRASRKNAVAYEAKVQLTPGSAPGIKYIRL